MKFNFGWRGWVYLLLLVIWLKFWFASGSNSNSVAVDLTGQFYKVPVSALELEPVDKALHASEHRSDQMRQILVSTPNCDYLFAESTATLLSLDCKYYVDKAGLPLRTLNQSISNPELGGFFLALAHESPVDFKLKDKHLDEGCPSVYFQATVDDWVIGKRFTFDPQSYHVRLELSFAYQGDPADASRMPLKPRLFLPLPLTGGVLPDSNAAVCNQVNSQLPQAIGEDLEKDHAWKLPYVFGGQDRYFVHAWLAGQQEGAVRRAFVDRTLGSVGWTILELWPVDGTKTVDLNFYMGPKELGSLQAANTNLEGLLSFGWLSWLCKLLLALLGLIYSLVGNYGWAIVLMGVCVKCLDLPIFIAVRRKLLKYKLFEQRFAVQIEDINKRNASNAVVRSEQLERFYQSHGLSQYGKFWAIVPTFIHLPVAFALYRVLGNYIGLYNAPFVGWIVDLSVRDPWGILPLFLAGVSFLQGASLRDKNAGWTMYLVPVITWWAFSRLPVGVVLYWFTHSLFSVVEEFVIDKYLTRNLK